eukprot:4742591-Amphidinium_carterae.2
MVTCSLVMMRRQQVLAGHCILEQDEVSDCVTTPTIDPKVPTESATALISLEGLRKSSVSPRRQ